MDRNNPYEAAFEAYLQHHGLCYVAIDETRRAFLGETPLKNLDFMVLGACGSRLLIDVKGRQFPGGPPEKPRYTWENWTTQDDIQGLQSWSRVFGPGYRGLFVFIYRIQSNVTIPRNSPDLWTFRDETYLLRSIELKDYMKQMRVRSPKWGTVCLPGEVYRSLARPFRYFTHELIHQEEWNANDSARCLPESLESPFAPFPFGNSAVECSGS